jgi:PAS domain S-box-containing protein
MLKNKKKANIGGEQTTSNRIDYAMLQAKDPLTWDVQDVAKWLHCLGFDKYKKIFEGNCIGGQELFSLEDEDLTSMGISALGHRKKLLATIRNLTVQEAHDDTSSTGSGSTETTGSGSSKVTFKCVYEGDIRLIHSKYGVTVSKLKRLIKEEYGKSLSLTYSDAEGDVIPIRKDRHLNEALKTVGDGNLRLNLVRRQSSILTKVEESIFEGLVDGVVVIDSKGSVHFINKAALEIFKYRREEVVGKNIKMLMPPKTAEQHDGFLSKYVATGKSSIIGVGRAVVAKQKDGNLVSIWLSLSETKKKGRHSFTGTLHRVVGSGTDNSSTLDEAVNTKVYSRDNVQQAMSAHFGILETLLDAAIMIDEKGIVQFCNTVTTKLFGHPKQDIVGKNVKLLMTGNDAYQHDNYIRNYLKTGKSTIMGKGRDVLALCKDGSMIALHLSLTEHAVGSSRYIIGLLRHAEAKLETKSVLQEAREVIDSLVVPGIVIEQRGTIQGYNEAASRVFGYSLNEVVGRKVNMLMTGADSEKHDNYIKSYIDTGVKKVIGKEREVVGKSKEGMMIPLVLSVTERRDGENRIFIGMLRDKM